MNNHFGTYTRDDQGNGKSLLSSAKVKIKLKNIILTHPQSLASCDSL